MAFRLAREEGLFGGTSTGANVAAALRLAERLGSDATVVTILCDTGMKYLNQLSGRLEEPAALNDPDASLRATAKPSRPASMKPSAESRSSAIRIASSPHSSQ